MRAINKILFITTIEFHPPFNGGTFYSLSVFEALQHFGEVDVFVLREARCIRTEPLHKVACMLYALTSDVPLNVLYHSGLITRSLPDLRDYDLVVVDHIESYEAVRMSAVPCIIVAHNLEYKLANDKIKSKFLTAITRLHARLERYERSAFSQVSGVICISATEQLTIQEATCHTVQLLPTFKPSSLTPRAQGNLRLGFLGPADWAPNWRIVTHLVKKILPHLSRPFELVLAGKGWKHSGITFPRNTQLMGFVKNTEDFWNSIDLLVSPSQQGAGVNIKICEALHAGLTVLTNTTSATAIFGTGPVPDNILLADTDDSLISTLEQLTLPLPICKTDLFTQANQQDRLRRFLEDL